MAIAAPQFDLAAYNADWERKRVQALPVIHPDRPHPILNRDSRSFFDLFSVDRRTIYGYLCDEPTSDMTKPVGTRHILSVSMHFLSEVTAAF